jgi:hypothetical protein
VLFVNKYVVLSKILSWTSADTNFNTVFLHFFIQLYETAKTVIIELHQQSYLQYSKVEQKLQNSEKIE